MIRELHLVIPFVLVDHSTIATRLYYGRTCSTCSGRNRQPPGVQFEGSEVSAFSSSVPEIVHFRWVMVCSVDSLNCGPGLW